MAGCPKARTACPAVVHSPNRSVFSFRGSVPSVNWLDQGFWGYPQIAPVRAGAGQN
jgi:hypothetical protein